MSEAEKHGAGTVGDGDTPKGATQMLLKDRANLPIINSPAPSHREPLQWDSHSTLEAMTLNITQVRTKPQGALFQFPIVRLC